MQRCDVLIVGGGPAGSSCAWALRSSGLDARIIDRKAFPRDKVCAGWITPQVVDALEVDLDDYARAHVCQPITGFRTGMLGGTEVENHYDRPVSYGIRRCEFDTYLLERTGVPRLETEAVDSIERSGGEWIVNGTIAARLLIGAGGHFCPVARMLGARSVPGALVVAAQEIEFAATDEQLAQGTIAAEVPELFFCDDLEGYAWCFRKGNYLNIGLGRTQREQLSTHVSRFVEFLKSKGKVTGDLPGRFHGHAYQVYERTQPVLCDDGVLLVGDAAGLAYPQSGEGIRPAVESGLLAAGVIAEVAARSAGNFSREHLQPYSQRLQARLGPPRASSASQWLPASWLRVLAARLMASKHFSRRVVLERWFLHMHQPALVPHVSTLASAVHSTANQPG